MSFNNLPRGARELGRELALISLYMLDVSHENPQNILSFKWYEDVYNFSNEDNCLFFIPPAIKSDAYGFSGLIINGVFSNLVKVDTVIKKHLINWNFERLHAIDKAILRISIYSLLYQYDIPVEVTISEANEMSEKYCEENTSFYINGILHKIKQEYRKNFITEDKKQNKIQIKIKSKKQPGNKNQKKV